MSAPFALTPEERERISDVLTEYLLNHHRGIEYAAEIIRRLVKRRRSREAVHREAHGGLTQGDLMSRMTDTLAGARRKGDAE